MVNWPCGVEKYFWPRNNFPRLFAKSLVNLLPENNLIKTKGKTSCKKRRQKATILSKVIHSRVHSIIAS